jgi:hypothetical protein
MNIEHWFCLSWFLRKYGRLKRKNHAQDCGTLIAKLSRSQRPAILPWFSSLKWRPSFRWYGRFTRYRPAAGLLLDTLSFGHDLFRKPDPTFRDHARARTFQSPRVNRTQRVRELC